MVYCRSSFSVVYYGQIGQGDAVQEIGFYCSAGSRGSINTFDSVADGALSSEEVPHNILWRGKVNYEKDRFVLIRSDSNKLFSEDAFPIEFIREDLTEEEIREISPWDEDGNLKDREAQNEKTFTSFTPSDLFIQRNAS